ncbi:hypothetical protein RE428_18030 [Marinobacter nanhaiticus D15-8W]|nr:hypothetical protein RE428_18030 [Marinobacter nanhaiticus D15-8W]
MPKMSEYLHIPLPRKAVEYGRTDKTRPPRYKEFFQHTQNSFLQIAISNGEVVFPGTIPY